MYAFLRTLLWLIWIWIAVFHIKAYKFNKNNKNLIIASFEKDIWPYRLLWGIRLILFLLMLFYKWIATNWWSYVWDRFEDVKNKVTNNKDIKDSHDENSQSKNNKYTPTTGWNTTWADNDSSNNSQRWIVNEEQIQKIEDRSGVIINPITDWYYEIITSDPALIRTFIDTTEYIIPKPINVQSCSLDYAYWNLWPEHLNYNSFLYEYINSHKEKDILVALLDSWIDWDNKTLKWHTATNSNETIDWKDTDFDWYIDDIAWVNIISWNWDTQDYNGHWTHVAWIVLQTFPNASILPIKITKWSEEYIDEYAIIKWLRYAIDADVDIISMSFWGKWSNKVTEALIKEATDKWIIVIAAAGNEWENVIWHYPASYTWVINVGSIWQKWISNFSNTNSDILFPWECIRSYGLEETKVFWWWTSMSAPHLAWILWTYLSIWKNLWNKSEMLTLLNKNSKTVNKNKIVDAPKLFELENDNNNAYKYIGTIDSTLKTIGTKLNKLQNSRFTEQDLNSVASYKSTLSANATNLWNIYQNLWINDWFGIELKKDIDEYNSLLWQLNTWWLYLEVDWWTLSNSLWISTCKPYPTNCDVFDTIISKWTQLPNSNYKKWYSTPIDYQSSVLFKIYQWENLKASNNHYLWNLILYIPKKPAGQVTMTVYFNIDKNWKLSVTAEDENNPNNKISTTVTAAKDVIVITWDNYYKAKETIEELVEKTDTIEKKIQKFYNLNPFNYIPETSSWSYKINKTEFNIPDFKTDINLEIKDGEKEISTWSKSNIKENIRVEEVIDGDTIRVTLNWQSEKIRLIWVDAPESYDTRRWYTECFWTASSNYLTNLLSNKTIWLEYDSTQWMYDKYGRILAYIFLNWENINKKIISDWYAREYTYNMPYKYQKEFKKAETSARTSNKWLWNKNTCGWERKEWN